MQTGVELHGLVITALGNTSANRKSIKHHWPETVSEQNARMGLYGPDSNKELT